MKVECIVLVGPGKELLGETHNLIARKYKVNLSCCCSEGSSLAKAPDKLLLPSNIVDTQVYGYFYICCSGVKSSLSSHP